MSNPGTGARTTATTGEQTALPYKSIFVPGGRNARTDLPEIERLGASMKQIGQLAPVIVTNGGSPEQPYTLVAGFRRMAAFALNKWTGREVLCVVREYQKGDVLSRIADNWTENVEREGLSPLDQAATMRQLVDGTYPVAEGEEAVPIDKDVISLRFGITRGHLGKLLKITRDIRPDVADLARKHDAPLRLLVALSQAEGEDEPARDKNQIKTLNAWIETQAALAAAGRQRGERSDKGQKKPSAISSSAISQNGNGILRLSKRLDERGTVEDYLRVLRTKVEAKGHTKDERLKMAGMIEVFRWLSGDLKKLPGLVAADFEALVEEEEEEMDEEDSE